MNLNPKRDFMGQPDLVERHRKLIDDPETRHLIEIAFAEYTLNLPAGDNPAKAWDANSRRQGAAEFIQLFLTFSDPVKQRNKPLEELEYDNA